MDNKESKKRSNRRHFLATSIAFITAALFLGLTSWPVLETESAWNSKDSSIGNFKATSIQEVSNLSCFDQDSANLNLLDNTILLTWGTPVGIENVPSSSIEYVVTWTESGLLGGKSGTVTTGATEYIYTPTRTPLAGLLATFTVHAKIKGTNTTWTGPSSEISALAVSILFLDVAMLCR